MISASMWTGAPVSRDEKDETVGPAGLCARWRQRLVTRMQQLRAWVYPEALPTPQQKLLVAGASLRLACLPAFLYLGSKPTQSAYQRWQQEGRVTLAVVESAAVALCLVNGAWLVGSLGLSLYYLGQVVADEGCQPKPPSATWQPPVWAWQQSPDGEVVTPVGRLQVGDHVVVHASEMVPVTGVVASGTAWVRIPEARAPVGPADAPVGVKVSAGDQVAAATIVLAGLITVVVTAEVTTAPSA